MSLKRTIAKACKAALDSVRDLMVEVEWTFVASSVGDYNPTTDSYTQTQETKTIKVLAYDGKEDDDQVMFSSRGNFVETPGQLDSFKIIMSAEDAGTLKPTVRDTFTWDGDDFLVFSREPIPGDPIFILGVKRK